MTVKPIPRVIDISHYNVIETFQHAIDLGIWGVIHKASENVSVSDKKLEAGRFMVSQVPPMLWGTYHFIRHGNVAQQVEFYLKNAKPKDDDLMALDWEDNKVRKEEAAQFLQLVKEKTGRMMTLYSGNTAKELIKIKDNFFGAHKLWLPQYGNEPTTQKSWDNFWLWQYTGDGKGQMPHTIEGIAIPGNNGMDINHYAGSKDQLIKEWNGA